MRCSRNKDIPVHAAIVLSHHLATYAGVNAHAAPESGDLVPNRPRGAHRIVAVPTAAPPRAPAPSIRPRLTVEESTGRRAGLPWRPQSGPGFLSQACNCSAGTVLVLIALRPALAHPNRSNVAGKAMHIRDTGSFGRITATDKRAAMDIDINEQIKTIGAAMALIGALGSTAAGLFSWLEKRSIKSKYQDEINFAERRIAFVATWYKAQEAICSPQRLEEIKLQTSQELDALRTKLAQFIADSEERSGFSRSKYFQRAFLLHLPHNFGGWVSHLMFYLVLAVALLYISITPETNDLQSWTTWAGDSLVGLVIFVIPLLLLHKLALRFDRKRD